MIVTSHLDYMYMSKLCWDECALPTFFLAIWDMFGFLLWNSKKTWWAKMVNFVKVSSLSGCMT